MPEHTISVTFERADGETGSFGLTVDNPIGSDELADAAELLPRGAVVEEIEVDHD